MFGFVIRIGCCWCEGSTVDYRDGFVGCIRALMLNGELQDLRSRAEQGMFGVHGGCVGKCASSPCLNNGTCSEQYDGFSCECRWTAFKGLICADGQFNSDLKAGSLKYYKVLFKFYNLNAFY